MFPDATHGPGGRFQGHDGRHGGLVRYLARVFGNQGTVERDRVADPARNWAPGRGFPAGSRVGSAQTGGWRRSRRDDSEPPRLDRAGGSAAPVPPFIVVYRGFPAALRLRHRVRQRRPIGSGRLARGAAVPGRYAAIHVARAVRLVGLRGELVDDRRVTVVPAALLALGVAVFAAAGAEVVALGPWAVGAASASAEFGEVFSAPAAARGAPIETRAAAFGERAVRLDPDGPRAASLGTRWQGLS